MIIRTTIRLAKVKQKDGTVTVDPTVLVTTVYLFVFVPIFRFESLSGSMLPRIRP